MKKLAFIFGMAVAVCCLFAGCAKNPEARAISVFDSSSYTLPFTPDSANNHGSGTDFVSDLTLEEMRNEINHQDGTTAELYGDCLLIEKQNGERVDYYVVTNLSGNNFDFEMPAFYSESNDLILYPKHLFDLAQSDNGIWEVTEGKEYIVNGSADEFKQFYEKTGVFVVTQDENLLSIEWNKEFTLSDGEVINQGGASFTAAKYQGSSFTIGFTEDENGQRVSYSVSEAN